MSYYLKTVPLVLSALMFVRAHAVRANELVNTFQDSVVFTNVGYSSGSNVISNFPLRVDVSTSRPDGFDYDLAGDMASTLRFNFYDEFVQDSTNAVIDTTVYFAVTNWNPDGVTTFYVNVPRFCDSPKARLTMYWNPVDYAEIPPNLSIQVPIPITNASESAEWNRAIEDQATNANYIACGPGYRRVQHGSTWETKLLNYWLTRPTLSKTKWKQGEQQATVFFGVPASPDPVVSVEYFVRSDNSSCGLKMPLVPGAYRAVVTVAESGSYAKLSCPLDFDIVSGASVDGVASVDDFANHAEYSLSDEVADTSLAASFNYKLFETKQKTDATKAISSYNYKSEIKATGEVALGCWFRMDPAVVGKQMSSTDRDKVQLVSLCSKDGRGPLAIVIDNKSATELTLRVQGVGKDDGSASYNYTLLPAKSCLEIGDGQWHFVMATRCLATGEIRLYFDGKLFNETVNTAPFYDDGGENNFAIGCDPASPDNLGMSFVGQIAEAQVYNKVLDAGTVKKLYDGRMRLIGNEDGLLGYFPLNDKKDPWSGTGATLADGLNNGHARHDILVQGQISWGISDNLPFRGGFDVVSGSPFLVKIADDFPRGFYYDGLIFGKTVEAFYSDVRFFDGSGRPLNYVIDTWDPDGESYIWVSIPKIDENTRIVMCWGQGGYTELPRNVPSEVWGGASEEQIRNLRKYYLNNYDMMIRTGQVQEDMERVLQNRWLVEPSLSFTQWKPGDTVPTVNPGTTYGGRASVAYFDRSTGARLSSMPAAEVGEYRAVFTFNETERWSGLEKAIDFRIVQERQDHDLGDINSRVLLANNDGSVAGGEAYTQCYDDNEDGWGLPYWTHHEKGSSADVSDFDSTKLFADFNLFPGTCHEYMSGTNRIWGLVNVRFGNLFNNGRYHPGETGTDGLNPDQNYLPWNPLSERMLGYEGLMVGEYHRYAGTFLLQNVCDGLSMDYAQICSPCYDEGIGTIYFDVVNSFTDNVRDEDGGANYAIVVEVATNIVDRSDAGPVDGVWPMGIWSASGDGEVYDAYRYAEWHAVDMLPIRFRADTGSDVVDCEMLPATRELELDVTEGGTACNFYRVCVPLNLGCQARFRIRRTRIDRSASLNPDANAFVIVDNVICSKSREMIRLVPYGWFDPLKNGKQYLGQEAAFVPPFPGPRDAVEARVRALDVAGNDLEPGKVTAVTMHYRWHYLDQRRSKWQFADFDPQTLTAIEPLILPGFPGDVDFWFEGSQNCGYYTYANYSGTKLGVPGYSEAFALFTNGWNGVKSEWNFRIREGSSDWEGGVMVVREPGKADFEIPLELVDNHQWRAYYQTVEPIPEGAKVRFEMRNLQTPGDKEWSWNTNLLYCAERNADITPPFCGRMSVGTTNDWTHVPVDAATGYIMFQVDDASLGISVVRADYQNFNHWTDGHGDVFVGSAVDDSSLPASGVSPLTRDFTVYYDRLTNDVSVATNSLWSLDFETRGGYTYYKTFPAGTEKVNGWNLGKGRFVYGDYRMPGSGTAMQMNGCSEGYVEMSDQAIGLWPRGIEKVTFNARLAQSIEFDDFSYVDDSSRLKNYAFLAHAVFDHNKNRDFTGNASLSLVGYYRRGVGCYEARWEQVNGQVDTYGAVTGPASKGQRLSIYRWNRNGGGGYDQTLLCSFDNNTWDGINVDMPSADPAKSLGEMLTLPMSLAVYEYNDAGDVMIVVGVCSKKTEYATGVPAREHDTTSWQYGAYLDNSAQKLKSGAYGLLSANCPGMFLNVRRVEFGDVKPVWGSLVMPQPGQSTKKSTTTYPFDSSRLVSCRDDIADGFWVSVPGRSETLNESASVFGFKAADVWQTVDLVASPASGVESYSEVLKSFSISNHWGRINVAEEFGGEVPLVWRTRDAKIRLRTGGDLDDRASPAVVIDNVLVYQWRGKNEIVLYSTGDSPDNRNDCKVVDNGDPANYVYTGGWIDRVGSGTTAMEFSARRTIPDRPAGVRTPLMDGISGRGSGIGNICFSYRNAQTNIALLVQVATNVFRGDLARITADTSTDGSWRTVCRLTYDELGSSGVTNVTFGLRNAEAGYGCVARVILDPALCESVQTVSDVTAFGSILFDYVTCQDEPPIDKGCWWGWNLRTLGNVGDTENRMYLPDASLRPDPGYSLALNNSVEDDIVVSKAKEYVRYMPFVQSPAFTSNVIGQLTFRARKYSYSDRDQAAEVALYGITAAGLARNDPWTLLTRFAVTNAVFTSYSYRANLDDGFCAFRLGVTGVKGVDPLQRGPNPVYGTDPVRVLLDEIVVSEAVNPELSFRGVGAFRSDMSGTGIVPSVPSRQEQPLCGEGWGVQCELFAVMLAEEIDTSRPPRVKLYWYEGDDVWGYDRWKDLPEAKSAWLARAADTDLLVYRSSYDTAPDAVIPQSKKDPGGFAPVVQYMLEAFYTVVDPKTGVKTETRKLLDVKGGQWTVPEWYAPVDYNVDSDYGDRSHWSCFCILDDLAPGWAWINEVNIFSDENHDWDNDDSNCQFIEIAAPRDIDLSGWRIELLEPREYSGQILTNTVAVFGRNGLSGTKNVNVTSNYVFHVIGTPDHYSGDRSVLERDGALDGVWNFESPTAMFDRNGIIDWGDSFAIRLLRPNGIVEHEIVTVGTNIYTSAINAQYMPTGVVAYLNRELDPARFFYPGQDSNSGDHSVGVVNSKGEGPVCWNTTMRRTPGTINEDQQIDPDYPVPMGEMMSIFLDLDQTGGRIWHSFDGGLSFTNESKRIFLKNGSILGTNVIYKVEPWYEVDFVKQTSSGKTKYFDVSNGFDRVERTVEVTLGRLCSNRVDVVGKATPDRQLKDLGCDEKNIYTPAVIDWLQHGETLRGPFARNDGVVRLAEFWGLHSGRSDPPRYLTLTEMYWLDIDPTIGEMVLQAGMCKPPSETLAPIYDGYAGPGFVTNLTMSVFMMITNKTDDAGSEFYGQAWSPYVLRGVKPGDCSTNYVAGSGLAWTSETFKISGILPNGHTSESIRDNWVDLRWFIFMPDSFYQPSDEPAHQRFTTDIEIRDPVNSLDSPGYGAGWYDWVHDPEHPEQSSVRPFFRWSLDTRLRPFEVEILKTNNLYRVTAP